MTLSAIRFAKIGDYVSRAETWNPGRSAYGRLITYIDLSSIDNAEKSITECQSILAADAPSRARQLVRAGDILISTVRPNLNGVARVPEKLDGATASTGFCILRPVNGGLSSEYLFHWVRSPFFIDDMARKATGASYPAVTDRIILESEIPLPPPDEQRRIAAILDQADALRRKRREALLVYNRLQASIFIDLFGNPVANPKRWPDDEQLGDIAEIVSGITKGRKLNGAATREVPYLAVINVQDRALNLGTVKTIEATEDEITRYSLKEDDLVLTEGGDPDKLGRGTVWKNEIDECIHQNHIFRVRIQSNNYLPIFVSWLIGSERGKQYFLRSAKQTTGIASINMTQLRSFPLLRPTLDEQRRFVHQISTIDETHPKLEQHLKALNALFASLQHRAFRGEL